MEFVIWFGVVLAAAALAGDHLFEVILVAAAVQVVIALAAVFRWGRRFPGW